jgi:anti-anti-sigma factor
MARQWIAADGGLWGAQPAQVEPAQVEVVQPGCWMVVRGRIDSDTVGQVRPVMQLIVDSGCGELILDVGQADIPDSWGLGLLLGLHQRARVQGRTLVLVDIPPRLRWLINHTRLHRVLQCRTSGHSSDVPLGQMGA